MTRSLFVIGLVSLAAGCSLAPGKVDPLASVNAVRANGCAGRPGARVPLRTDVVLDRVAERLSNGGTLVEAIDAERYPAARSTSIQIVQAPDDPAVVRLLETRFCAEITDGDFEAIGAAARPGRTWLVLAAPFKPPQVTDATAAARRVLELVNAARSRPRQCGSRRMAATTALSLDATLGRVADAHARDMARHSRLSHAGSDGSTVGDRVSRAGYAWRSVAENIASGQRSAEEVVETWLESPGHCANLMSPDMRQMGVAYSFDASSDAGTYWVQVFAARR